MSRLSLAAVTSALALFAMTGVTVAPASDGDDPTRAWKVIRLVERAQDFAFQDLDPPGPSLATE
jgi:hypothetical protein